jgi:hypothetical protein
MISAACVATAVTLQHPAFGKLAHHLLNEERIARRPPYDQRPNRRDRGVGSQQLIEQLPGLAIRLVGPRPPLHD